MNRSGSMVLGVTMVALTGSLAAAGCGDETAASNSPDAGQALTNRVQGQVNGRSFEAKDAISALVDHTNGFMFDGTVPFIEMSDFADNCSLSAQKKGPAYSRVLDLAVAVNDASGKSSAPTAPGTFIVHDDSVALPANANIAQVYYGSALNMADLFQ